MMTTTSGPRHGMHWAPGTRSGTWAVYLAGLALAGTVSLAIAFAAGMEPADSFSDKWFLTVVGVGILGSAAASAVTGVTAIVRSHERSWLVIAGTVVGGLLTALMLQQVIEGLGWLGG